MDNSYVVVGFPSGKVAPLNTQKAVWNEFGTKKIPSRPFMRYTFKKYMDKVKSFEGALYGQILKGTMTTSIGLRKIGEFYAALIKLSIRTGPWKPNAPSTTAKKKSSKPLIDLREMLNAITYKVFSKRL